VFAVAIAVLGATAYALRALGTGSSPGGQTTPTPSPRYFAFMCPATRPGAPRVDCARLAREASRRTPLTGVQREAGEQVAIRIRVALTTAWLSPGQILCVPPTAVGRTPEPCRYAPAAPTATDVDQARRGLAAAGFTDATVRLARADDPAPPGAMLYAVPAGHACVLGYEADRNEREYGSYMVVGRLPSGECFT
jgi:hypothetical protein